MPPLRMPHHATLCSSCLNCQSNFRLKVFLLFLTPTAVSFFVYSFFCFSHASVLPDFLNWLFTLPPLRMPPHATLCSSICSSIQHLCFSLYVSVSVIQHSCFSIYVSASVIQQSCSSIHVPAVVFQHSCSSSHVSAFVFQQSCSSICDSANICVRTCVAASVFAFCVAASVYSFVLQHLCSCFSNCVPASAIVFQLLCSNTCACSITNRLSSMTISNIYTLIDP
jgi:hypothetical protein